MLSLKAAATSIGVTALAVTLSGCATVATVATHGSLEASTKMSSSVFLDPIAKSERTVFVQVHNTTDQSQLPLEQQLIPAIQARGWNVVDDPAAAKVVLQVNVLQAGKIQPNALQSALGAGYGAGILGSAGLAASTAALAGGGGTAIGGAALGLGAADFVGGLLVKNVTYSVITDVRVMQRGAPGQKFTVQHNTGVNAGSASVSGQSPQVQIISALLGGTSAINATTGTSNVGSTTTQSYTEQSDFKIHQTRIVSSANQVNLGWDKAEPVVVQGLTNSIAGLF